MIIGMSETIKLKERLGQKFFDSPLSDWLRHLGQRWDYFLWKKGLLRTTTPVLYKYELVRRYASLFSVKIFIETGTYLGDMVFAQRKTFGLIHSIELSPHLYQRALHRFSREKHILLREGDSAEVLPEILTSLSQSALFWLDAHYSGGLTARGTLNTPILAELKAILSHPIRRHLILIDDADCFNGRNDFPFLEDLVEFIRQLRPDLKITIEENVIVVSPKNDQKNSFYR